MKYKRAICIYPYKRELRSYGFFPPLGLEYVASAIEDIVEGVKIIDLRYEKGPLSTLMDKEVDLALVSYNWGEEKEWVEGVMNSIPQHIPLIVGGRYATERVDELFRDIPRIDGIVRGDGEETTREIVYKGLSPDIDGLSFRLNGQILHNKNRKLEPVRSDFYPKRNLRSYKYMVAFEGFTSDVQIDLMLGSRGCPYNCHFCDFKFNPLGEKRKWSVRSPESIVSEIKSIEADLIGFVDDIFTADMDWVEKVCDLIIEEGIKKKYFINARLEVAKRPDVLKKMYKAGFAALLLGIESAQDKTLASMSKGFTTSKVRDYFEVLRRFNFIYHCYYIIGNVGETKAEMLDIAPFSRQLGVDTLGLSILRVHRYSPLKDMLKERKDYHIEEGSGKVYSDGISLEELQQIRRRVNASFFTVPVILRIIKKLIIHRILTLGRAYRIIGFATKKELRKIAKKIGILSTQN